MKNDDVIWKDIPGYEGLYKISSEGIIKSVERWVHSPRQSSYIKPERIMKPYKNKNGYLYIQLSKDGVTIQYRIHKLVALAFLDNPNNYSQINHKNENRSDNRVENLEWCTASYNCNYGTRNIKLSELLSESVGRPVLQFSKSGVLLGRYSTISEAGQKTGVATANIICCANGRKFKANNGKYYIRYSAGGYVWKYA